MSNPDDARSVLKQAFQLIKAGEKQQARKIIGEFLKTYPRSADGWYLAALVTDEPDKKLKIVERVLSINPQHSEGKKLLDELTASDDMLNDLLRDTEPDDEPATPAAAAMLPKGTADFLKGRGFWFAVGALIVLILFGSIFVVGQSRGELLGIVFRASITPIPTNTPLPTFTRTPTFTPSPSSTPTFTPSPTVDYTETAAVEFRKIGTVVAMTLTANPNTSSQSGETIILSPLNLPSPTPENRIVKDIVPIDYTVRDAAYDSALQKIIMISDSTKLHIYDPETQNDQVVELPRETLSLSVSPDGQFAAVGHDALISYVDLQNGTLVKTLDIAIRDNVIVLAGNGWIYTGQGYDFERMTAIEIASGRQLEGPGINSDRVLRLHPDGQKIYGANVGLYPDDIERIDISLDGFPNPNAHARDSRYHGDYAMCGDLWFSQNGERIFTACGAVFRSSDNAQQEMTYNGSISQDLRKLSYVAHSQAAGIVVGLSADDSRENLMGVWDYEFLTLNKMMALPDYHGQVATGHFVFFNPTSTRYYIILSTYTDPTHPRSFGIVEGDFADLNGVAQTSAAPSTPLPQSNVVSSGMAVMNFSVIDAEYSLPMDRIIAVSASPNQLHIYNPLTNLDSVVSLAATPMGLSVSPDGLSAAVSQTNPNTITIVDLKTAQVTKTLNIGEFANNVVLGGNGWVYFSATDTIEQRLKSYAVEIVSNREVSGSRVHFSEFLTLHLHPDGKKIYGADKGISPDDILRFDITSGGLPDPLPPFLIDSPYHGDYPMCGNLWFSQDGQRIFTACGNVFNSSDNDQDMTHIGILAGTQFGGGATLEIPAIRNLIQSGGLLLGVPLPERPTQNIGDSMPENRLAVWNAADMSIRKIVPLQDWSTNGQSYVSNGRFVFVNAAGTEYYVIVQADEKSGLLHDFGVIIGNISDL